MTEETDAYCGHPDLSCGDGQVAEQTKNEVDDSGNEISLDRGEVGVEHASASGIADIWKGSQENVTNVHHESVPDEDEES